MRRDARHTHHLATLSHDGRFWDAYVELEDPRGGPGPARGRISFSPAGGDAEPVHTATIFLEDTPEAVIERARGFETHQLVSLLRSCAPGEPA